MEKLPQINEARNLRSRNDWEGRVKTPLTEQYDIDVFSENIFLTQTVDWTEAMSVTMILNVEAGGQGYYNGSNGFASADASNTLSFSKTGPVFILPEGFTVNAPELNIFDNRWIDPRTVAPSPVPLPAGAPLLLAGLAALWFKGRRTGRQARKIAAVSLAAVLPALFSMLPLQVNAATVSTIATIVANSNIDPTCGTATSIKVDNPTGPVTVFDSGRACNAYAEVDINQGVIGVSGSVEQGLGSASSAKISASGMIFATGICGNRSKHQLPIHV